MARLEFLVTNPRKSNCAIEGVQFEPVSDYEGGCPFNNIYYKARPGWVDNTWAKFDGTYSDDGWPEGVGSASSHIQTVLHTSPADGDFPYTDYRCSWVGGNGVKPSIIFNGGSAGTVTDATNPQHTDYNITAMAGTITFKISKADIDASPGGAAAYALDPIRDVEICETSLAGTTRVGGANFIRQSRIDAVAPWGHIRVMNEAATNQKSGNTTYNAAGKTKPYTFATFSHGPYNGGAGEFRTGGMPLRALCELVSACGVQGWYCVPGEFTDAAVTDWATDLVTFHNFDTGPPIIELSNEMWNFGFAINAIMHQTGLAEEVATESSPGAGDGRHGGDSYPAWRQSGFRAKQVMDIIETVFDAAGKDFCPVLCMQTGYTGRNKNTYECNSSEPFDSGSTDMTGDFFPTFGFSGYFGSWFTGSVNWISGGALNTTKGGPGNVTNGEDQSPDFTEGYDSIEYEITQFHTNGAIGDTWQKNADQVFVHWPDKSIVAYEANHHCAGYGGNSGTPELLEFVNQYQSDRFAELLRLAHETWCGIFTTAGGKVPGWSWFTLTGPSNPDGYWSLCTTLEDAAADSDGSFKLLDAARLVSGQHSSFQL